MKPSNTGRRPRPAQGAPDWAAPRAPASIERGADAAPLLHAIAQHAQAARPGTSARSAAQLECARAWLVHALARALTAGRRPELARFLAPRVPGGVMPGGARVPGTSLELDPVQAAFVNALLSGWECGSAQSARAAHPCQHAGALLAVADAQARRALMQGQAPMTVRELAGALLTSYEIHAGLAQLTPALHGRGDPALLLQVAQTAVITVLLGGSLTQTLHALTQALLDGPALPLSAGRDGPGDGTDRRAAECASRAVRLALWTLAGEPGYPGAWETPHWGFCAVVLGETGLEDSWAPPLFAGCPLPEQPGGPDEALLQLVTAASHAFRPQQLERINAWLQGPAANPAASLDARPVSELMAHLTTHAVRERSRQLALLP